MSVYDITGNVIAEKNDEVNASIISLNKDVKDALIQAKRRNNDTMNGYLNAPQPLVLLHFSDIHGDSTELERIIEFYNYYHDSIDDVICTGDMVEHRFSEGMTWWDAVEGSENILTCIGNHDALADTSGYDWTNLATEANQYSQYFAPYISNWGCTYTAGKTYYYKDYTAKNVRLIVVNCMLTGNDDAAQKTWFESALSGAKTAGLSVVIADHYIMSGQERVECNFSSIERAPGTNALDSDYVDAVQSFVSDGGEFVCYIAGHVHVDYFAKSATYTNQTCILIDAASVRQSNLYSDTQRTEGTKSQDLINLLVIDTASKAVKIIRAGADMDHYLRSKKQMTYKYLTGDIIAEN